MAFVSTHSMKTTTDKLVTSSDGAKIFAQSVGDARLPTLVFIHGFCYSTLVWASALRNADLQRHFHLVSVLPLFLLFEAELIVRRSTYKRLPTIFVGTVVVPSPTTLRSIAQSTTPTISTRSSKLSTLRRRLSSSGGE